MTKYLYLINILGHSSCHCSDTKDPVRGLHRLHLPHPGASQLQGVQHLPDPDGPGGHDEHHAVLLHGVCSLAPPEPHSVSGYLCKISLISSFDFDFVINFSQKTQPSPWSQ